MQNCSSREKPLCKDEALEIIWLQLEILWDHLGRGWSIMRKGVSEGISPGDGCVRKMLPDTGELNKAHPVPTGPVL